MGLWGPWSLAKCYKIFECFKHSQSSFILIFYFHNNNTYISSLAITLYIFLQLSQISWILQTFLRSYKRAGNMTIPICYWAQIQTEENRMILLVWVDTVPLCCQINLYICRRLCKTKIGHFGVCLWFAKMFPQTNQYLLLFSCTSSISAWASLLGMFIDLSHKYCSLNWQYYNQAQSRLLTRKKCSYKWQLENYSLTMLSQVVCWGNK